jgi:hypothetical protein
MAIGIQTGTIPPQVLDKVTSEHSTSLVESIESESKRQHDLAMSQLASRERDRQHQRDTDRRRERSLLIFAGGVLGFVLLLSALLLQYGQADLIKVVIPSVLSAGLGFAAGMGYQRSRQ